MGVGATVVAGGVTIGSAVDTASKNSAFNSNSCHNAQSRVCQDLASSGPSAQARTNVLLGVTAVLGVATVALIPFIRWHGMTAAVTAGGLAFDARF